MAEQMRILVGTKKGAFIFEGDTDRRSWTLKGPFCEAWPINHIIGDPSQGLIYAGGGNEWFGPAVWKSSDFGESWTHSSEGLAYGEGEEPIKAVWSLSEHKGVLYAGVEPAGLFRSDDQGETWRHIEGLRNHPTRKDWQPGGGGLILHSILHDPGNADRIWVAISTAGTFYTEDGGATWEPRNKGVRCDFLPEDQRYPEFGQCVHSMVMAAGMPDRIYQQNHCGMYRTDDGGKNWSSIESGLPSSFGFPSAAHPRDPETLFLIPLNGDSLGRYAPDGKAAVWKTRDGGASWAALRNGLPQENVFFGVLRQAMAVDRLDPSGVYFGTGSGSLYISADEGDSWNRIAEHLPVISSIEILATGA